MSKIEQRATIEGVGVHMERSVYGHSPTKAYVTVDVHVSSLPEPPHQCAKFFIWFPDNARVTNDDCEAPGLLEIMWDEPANERDLAVFAEEQAAEQQRVADAEAYQAWLNRRGPVGTSSERQSVGAAGHCDRCLEVGHVRAHPDLGCADVGCDLPAEQHPIQNAGDR